MSGRIIAIGDIHGCAVALSALIEAIDPRPNDTIIPLGDYVDRGLDSRGVLDQLIDLERRCQLIPILGNHDEMMLHARDSESDFQDWMTVGGAATLDSYGSTGTLAKIPLGHFEFLARCRSYYETETHLFVHANYQPNLPLDQQDDHHLRWLSLRDSIPESHMSGKVAVVGHTPQPDILDLGYLIDIDTGCCRGGWLTALDPVGRQAWQFNERGQARTPELDRENPLIMDRPDA
ncbi:metallophosphoesterase [Schlesneria paludicola]|uniref:metallophosphoesterase n=1 Tax=Schlesneria paludicola TaxID=360056 RepID=UPI00029ACD87|nr:metallophosphoesterase [Schlesneria paludicola]